MTIALCDSLSTWIARSIFGIPFGLVERSTTTATPWGTSSRVFRRICSRTNSATKKRIGLSLMRVVLEEGGPLGQELGHLADEVAPPLSRSALIGTIAANSRPAASVPFEDGKSAAFAFTLVDLVDDEDDGLAASGDRPQDPEVVASRAACLRDRRP